MVWAVGHEVERWSIQAVLGAGGMATVYRAVNLDTGAKAALKRLHLTSPAIAGRFVQEGKLQSRLHHANLVEVLDVLVVEEQQVLVLELVEGPSLDQALRAWRPSLEQIDDLVDGILAAVAFAHGNGVIHRDIKPANILLDLTDDRVTARVSDFGLAKDDDSVGVTRSGVSVGTPSYMAPEMHRGATNPGTRADIFALGASLYELATGVLALPGPSVVDCYVQAERATWKPPKECIPELPERMDRAIRAPRRPSSQAKPSSRLTV